MITRSRIYISAAHKSSGKTTLSIGLSAALSGAGKRVYPFKKGPDYIDPMWLARACEQPCYNLDFNTQDVSEINHLFVANSSDDGISIIEGNKGLYDGVDVLGSDSNAALVKQLRAPVVLVLDASGITRGIAPLVLGYQAFDKQIDIRGVILNKVGGSRVEGKLRAVLEQYTDVQVLGAVGRDNALEVRERHLGLTPPGEFGQVDEVIDRLRRMVEASVDLDGLVAIARSADELQLKSAQQVDNNASPDVRIGIARDAAFGFYYNDDLEALRNFGAELVFFDTLRDAALPDVDGLFIGGGFPETQMEALSANRVMRAAIADKARAGMPIYAECGGLMYLTRSIAWKGARFEMAGVIEADAVMHEKPQGRGLVQLERTDQHPWPGIGGNQGGEDISPKGIAAHEFHYASLENLGADFDYAYCVKRGTGIDGRNDGLIWNNVLAGFAHFRTTSRSSWTRDFIDFVKLHKSK